MDGRPETFMETNICGFNLPIGAGDESSKTIPCTSSNPKPGRCRTCAIPGAEMVSIYGPDGQNWLLEKKINAYLPITVSSEDYLPLTMCLTCVGRLEAGYKIFQSCVGADEVLRKSADNFQVKEEIVCFVDVDVPGEDHDVPDRGQDSDDDFYSNSNTSRPFSKPEFSIPPAGPSTTVLPTTTAPQKSKKRQTKKSFGKKKTKTSLNSKTRKGRGKIVSQSTNIESEASKKGPINKTFKCKQCADIFNEKHLYTAHLRQHRITDNALTHSCKRCGEKFRTAYLLSEHRKTHIPLAPTTYPCNECGKVFKTSTHLKQHRVIHSSEKPFQCHMCPRSFKRTYELTHHIKYHSVEKEYTCIECNKVFKNKPYLQKHIERHLQGEKNPGDSVICPICSESFKHKGALKVHFIHKHSDSPLRIELDFKLKDKTHLCSYCGAMFTTKPSLLMHINKHTKQKTYECKFCGKIFYYPSVLQQHIRSVHSEERPFACSYCDKRFRRRDGLVLHTRTHTGEKPFICNVCGQGFAQMTDMKKHRERH